MRCPEQGGSARYLKTSSEERFDKKKIGKG
jgi:hypothetical protein